MLREQLAEGARSTAQQFSIGESARCMEEIYTELIGAHREAAIERHPLRADSRPRIPRALGAGVRPPDADARPGSSSRRSAHTAMVW